MQNNFQLQKSASFMENDWLLVFCVTYLPITKRIILTKFKSCIFQISSWLYSSFPVYISGTSSVNTLLHNKVVSPINTSAFNMFIFTVSHEIITAVLFSTDSVKMGISSTALSSHNTLACLHMPAFKLPQSSCSWALPSSSLLVYSSSSPANAGGQHLLLLCSHCCLSLFHANLKVQLPSSQSESLLLPCSTYSHIHLQLGLLVHKWLFFCCFQKC